MACRESAVASHSLLLCTLKLIWVIDGPHYMDIADLIASDGKELVCVHSGHRVLECVRRVAALIETSRLSHLQPCMGHLF